MTSKVAFLMQSLQFEKGRRDLPGDGQCAPEVMPNIWPPPRAERGWRPPPDPSFLTLKIPRPTALLTALRNPLPAASERAARPAWDVLFLLCPASAWLLLLFPTRAHRDAPPWAIFDCQARRLGVSLCVQNRLLALLFTGQLGMASSIP